MIMIMVMRKWKLFHPCMAIVNIEIWLCVSMKLLGYISTTKVTPPLPHNRFHPLLRFHLLFLYVNLSPIESFEISAPLST